MIVAVCMYVMRVAVIVNGIRLTHRCRYVEMVIANDTRCTFVSGIGCEKHTGLT